MESTADRACLFILLPPEVIENIFVDSVLGVKDLCRLCRTCSVFRDVLNNDSIWGDKFYRRWPRLHHYVQRRKSAKQNLVPFSWKSIIRQRKIVKQVVNQRLEDMAHDTRKRFLKYQKAMDEMGIYNFCELLPLDLDTELNVVFIVEELQKFLSRGHEWQKLTEKYYADKSLWFFHHHLLTPEVEQFVSTCSDEQDLEVGATLIAKWFQPRINLTVEDIKHEFDSLANLTKNALKTLNPAHPVLSSTTTLLVNETKSLWNHRNCREILQAIEIVFKSSFNKGFNSYYTPSNSFINIVLERKEGIPITLCLTVMSIARRLGLVLEPVNFPHHFILRWIEFPSKFGIDSYSFVDVFGGKFSMTYQDLIDSFSRETSIIEAHCDKCSSHEVLHRMLRNLLNLGGHQRADNGLDLLHHSVELSNLFIPHDIELAILSAQVSLHLKVNIPKALSRIQEAAGSNLVQNDILTDLQVQCQHLLQQLENLRDEEATTKPNKRRRDNVQVMFAVGMIMKHKRYNYTCVIRGWDEQCQASEQWIKQMNVDKCERGRRQPFYNIWAMDGSDRYAAEENLVLTKEPVMITHPEVGRLFETFTGQYYIPGPQLLADYPDDLNLTRDVVTKFFQELQ